MEPDSLHALNSAIALVASAIVDEVSNSNSTSVEASIVDLGVVDEAGVGVVSLTVKVSSCSS